MASVIHLDTHSAVWLHDGDLGRFHPSVLPELGAAYLMISPMVVLELHYLHEIGRLIISPQTMLEAFDQHLAIRICAVPFHDIVSEAAKLTWTRDPFDRIICATARVAGAPLLTKDGIILVNEPSAFWEHPPVNPGSL